MKVYVVFEDIWYEGGDVISVHSKEWFADYRAYKHAVEVAVDYKDEDYPQWTGHDWLAVEGYKDVTIHAFEVTP